MTTSGTLSNVTLAKIESRREASVVTDTDTLVCLEDIHSHIRCAESVVTRSHRRTLWCGDKEGNIVVREGHTLRPLYQIERKSYNVFVNSLVVAGEGRVWAGLGDGTLRLFDATTYKLADDFRAHASEITAMVVANMPTGSPELEHHMQVVVTASADWSIAKWDASTGQCLGRLQGHNNTVRCLCPTDDGEFLISGGDDGCTRLWSLSANREITYENQPEPCAWPMSCHQGSSVAGLVIVRDEYFVSIGKDGTAHACKMDGTGAWLKRVEKRPCALTSVLYDTANARLWIGGIDGVISVIDAQSAEFTLLATVHDHSGAYVSVLKSLGHHVTHNVWTLTSDGVLCRFAESNAQVHGYNARLMTREDENIVACEQTEGHIDALREQVVRNYNGLQAYRKELNETERIDSRNFDLIARISGNTSLKRKYMTLALKWLTQQRTRVRAEKGLAALQRSITADRMRGAYLTWMTHARSRNHQHSKAVFSNAMLAVKEALSVQRCCVSLMQAALKERIRKSLVNVLSQHNNVCQSYFRAQFFRKWLEFRTMRRSMVIKRQMLNSILRGPKEAMMRKYWNALVAVRLRKAKLARQIVVSTLVFRSNVRAEIASYFTIWVKFACEKLKARQLAEKVRALREGELQHPENKAIGLQYFVRWMVIIKANRHRAAERELAQTELEIKNWLDVLRETELDEEAIDRQMTEAERELERRKLLLADMQRTTRGAQRKVYELKRDIAIAEYMDQLRPNAPLSDRVDAIMLYFRAKGISGVLDFPSVLHARQAFDKNAEDTLKAKQTVPPKGKKPKPPPLAPFELGLKSLKITLWHIVKSRGNTPIETDEPYDWGIMEEWVARLRGKEAAEVVDALRQLIVMYDGTIATRKIVPEAAMQEFMWNAYLLMSLVTMEAQKSALDYVKEPEVLPDVEGLAPDDGIDGDHLEPTAAVPSQRVSPSPTKARAPSPLTGKKAVTPSAALTRRGVSPGPSSRNLSPPRPSTSAAMRTPLRSTMGAAPPTPRAAASAPTASPRPPATSSVPLSANAGKVLGSGTKPWLGFKIKVSKVGQRSVVTLENCIPGGPAAAAGLTEGDELLRFGGVAVTDTRAFNAIVARAASKPGMIVVAGVSRGGRMVDVTIVVGAKE